MTAIHRQATPLRFFLSLALTITKFTASPAFTTSSDSTYARIISEQHSSSRLYLSSPRDRDGIDDKKPAFNADRIINDLIEGKNPSASSVDPESPVRDQVKKIFDAAEKDLDRLKRDAAEEIEEARQALFEEAEERNRIEGEALLGKIDDRIEAFRKETSSSRDGLRRAVEADRNMAGDSSGGEARGLTLGSWGMGNEGGEEVISVTSAKEGKDIVEKAKVLIVEQEKPDGMSKSLASALSKVLSPLSSSSIEFASPSTTKIGGNSCAAAIVLPGTVSDGPAAERLVSRMLRKSSVGAPPSHIIFCSVLGTERSTKFPFSVQNVLGSIDKMRAAEDAVKTLCRMNRADYTIIKFGTIVSSKNPKVVDSSSAEIGAVALLPGDAMRGEIVLDTAAAILYQAAAMQPHARNATLSAVSAPNSFASETITQGQFDDLFLRLDGPELLRIDVATQDVDTANLSTLSAFVGEWAKQFGKEKNTGLTTKATVRRTDRVPFGVGIEFRSTKGNDYASAKEEKARKESEAEGGSSAFKEKKKEKREGGVEIVVEDFPSLRVRARRCNMSEDTIVKEMSEETILRKLASDIKIWLKSR